MALSYVELRVHGVSGTPPEDMLGVRETVQVGGDPFGRFFRPADTLGRPVDDIDGRTLEGYHWGLFTSGSWKQGLWLLLIPFGFVNTAMFMLPDSTDRRAARIAHIVACGALRLAGVALTAILVLAAAHLSVDLLAWQWTGLDPTGPLSIRSADPRGYLLLAFAVSGAVLFLLWSFGRKTVSGVATSPSGNESRGAPELTELAKDSFYAGDPDAPSLRLLHVAAGSSLLGALAFSLPRALSPAPVLDIGFAACLVLVAVTTVIIIALGDPGRPSQSWHNVIARWGAAALVATSVLAWLLGVLAILVVVEPAAVASYVEARQLPGDGQIRGLYPGFSAMATGMLITSVVAILVLQGAAAALALTTRDTGETAPPPPFQRFAGGMLGALVATIGVFVGVGFAAGAAYALFRVLRPSGDVSLSLPVLYYRIAYAWGLTAYLLVGVALVVLLRRLVQRAADRSLVRDSYDAAGAPDPLPAESVPVVAGALSKARLKYSLEFFAYVFAVFGAILSLAALTEIARTEWGWTFLPSLRLLSDRQDYPGPVDPVGVGTLLLLGLAGGLVLLGRGAIRQRSVRRGTSILWDIVSFWPHAVHPLVPPPYSQRAVEDIRARIAWHLDVAGTPRLVLAGHSQGSLLCLAAVLRLTDDQRLRIGLVTHGSQLQYAYPRAFPGYVNFPVLIWTFSALQGRWRSLFRDTDAIGGPVLSWNRTVETKPVHSWYSCRISLCPLCDSDGAGAGCPDSAITHLHVVGALDTVDPGSGVRRCGPEWRLLDPPIVDPMRAPRVGPRTHGEHPADPAWPVAIGEVLPSHEQGDRVVVKDFGDEPGSAVVPGSGERVRPVSRRQFDHGLSPPFSGGKTQR